MASNNYSVTLLDAETDAVERVIKIIDAGMAARLLISSAKVNLFDDFKDGEQTAETIAAKRQWDPSKTERLLNCFASMKILARSERGEKVEFGLTPSGLCLVSDSPQSVHEYIANYTSIFFGEMDKAVNKYVHAEYVPDSSARDENECAMEGLDDMKMYRCMDNEVGHGIDKMLSAVDLSKYKTCVDLGGGTGRVAVALTQCNPHMKVTIIELPHVAKIAKEHFLKGKDRISVMEGDFFESDIPKADLYVLSKVMHHWNQEQTDKMMRKMFKAINSGGALMFFEWCLYDSKDGPNTAAHTWDLLGLSEGGGGYSGKEFKQLMEKYGFRDFQLCRTSDHFHYDVLLAKKP